MPIPTTGYIATDDLNTVANPVANETIALLRTDGQLYVYNGATWTLRTGGAGDVVGPASATNNHVAVFDGSTGKLLKDGGVPVASGTVTSVGLTGTANQITVTGSSPITNSGSFTLSIPTSPTLPGTTTGTFSGNLTGNVTGNVTGTASGNLTAATGVTSVSKSGSTALHGEVALAEGANVTLVQSGQTITIAASGGGGGGSVASVSAESLSPLFTTTVNDPTTTPDIVFTLSDAAANTVLGNATGSSAGPSYGKVVTGQITDANVTLAKIANAAASSKLVGSGASGSGAAYTELTLGTNLSMSGTTLNATGGGGRTLIETLTVSSAAQTVTFAATLNGDSDGTYEIEGHIISGSSADTGVFLIPNSTTTGQIGNVSGGGVTRLQFGTMASGNTNKEIYIWGQLVAPTGVPRRFITNSYSTGTPQVGLGSFVGGATWTDQSTNITSLGIGGAVSDTVGVGSVINLYKRQ